MARIFINPGHAPDGNPDPGAVSYKGTRECDVALSISKLVAHYLEKVGHNCMVYQNDSLATICEKSNFYKPALFLSIHCNSASSWIASGTETFCYEYGTKAAQAAHCILWQIVDTLDNVNRGVKTARFYVLLHTDAPAVLVETEFLSNAEGEKILTTRQDDIARAIARGVTDYLNM